MNNGFLRQSTAVTVLIGPFIDSVDGVSTVDALTLTPSDLQISKVGGSPAAKNEASNATPVGNGLYLVTFNNIDTDNAGFMTLVVNVAGALYVRHSYQVVEEVVFDALYDTNSSGWPSTGLGARTVTITVNDGTNPVENAKVRISSGAESYVATTDAVGQVIFNVDDATWSVAIAKAGYTFGGANLLVDANINQAYSISEVVAPAPPTDPDKGLLYVYTKDILGKDEAGITLSARLDSHPAKAGQAISTSTARAKTNKAGYVELALVRNDVITVPANSFYIVTCRELGIQDLEVTLDQPTVNVADLIT